MSWFPLSCLCPAVFLFWLSSYMAVLSLGDRTWSTSEGKCVCDHLTHVYCEAFTSSGYCGDGRFVRSHRLVVYVWRWMEDGNTSILLWQRWTDSPTLPLHSTASSCDCGQRCAASVPFFLRHFLSHTTNTATLSLLGSKGEGDRALWKWERRWEGRCVEGVFFLQVSRRDHRCEWHCFGDSQLTSQEVLFKGDTTFSVTCHFHNMKLWEVEMQKWIWEAANHPMWLSTGAAAP